MKPTEILLRLKENDTVKNFIRSNQWEELGEHRQKSERKLAILGGLSLLPAVAGVALVIATGPAAAPLFVAGWLAGAVGVLGTNLHINNEKKAIEKKADFMMDIMQKAGMPENTRLGDLTPQQKDTLVILANENKNSLKEMRFGTVEALNNKISNLRDRFFGKAENGKNNSYSV
jgi:hypothetical protein